MGLPGNLAVFGGDICEQTAFPFSRIHKYYIRGPDSNERRRIGGAGRKRANRGDGLFLAALIVLILITFINGLIALLMTTRQHMASIQSEKKQQLEHLNTIFIMSGAAEVEAEKRQDLKYPPTNL